MTGADHYPAMPLEPSLTRIAPSLRIQNHVPALRCAVKRGTKTFLIWGLLLGVVFYAMLRDNRDDLATVSVEDALALIKEGSIVFYRIDDLGLVLNTADGESLAHGVAVGPMAPHATHRVVFEVEGVGFAVDDIQVGVQVSP